MMSLPSLLAGQDRISSTPQNLIELIEFLASESVTIDCEAPFQVVTVNGTTIISPNYPYDYEGNKDCQVTIRFAYNQVGAIMFEAFDVKRDTTCSFDYLAVHDGNDTDSPMIGPKLCGTSPAGTTLKSTGNVMTLHFHTDRTVTRSGFKID